ncbi:MAG: hypothetical protein N3E50_08980 [Candidatus Goldbacteria bacterium]|nr:hypothetical protein [Candidatus Goldiibacteriota bacterium]
MKKIVIFVIAVLLCPFSFILAGNLMPPISGAEMPEFAVSMPFPNGPGNMEMDLLFLADKLNLSDKQVKELEKIRKENERKLVELRQRAELCFLDIRNELDKDEPIKEKIDSLIKEIATIHEEILRIKISIILKHKQILTREQFEKLKKEMFLRVKDRPGFHGIPGQKEKQNFKKD